MKAPRVSDRCLEELYLGLARLLSAGMPAATAMKSVGDVCAGRLRQSLDASARLVEGGTSVAAAGRRCGWLSPRDAPVVTVGERAGRLDAATELLSQRYRGRVSRAGRVRAGLVLPVFVLVLGLFLAPLPRLVGGTLDASGYFGVVLLPLVSVLLIGVLVARMARSAARDGWAPSIAAASVAIPVLGPLVVRSARAELLEALSQMLGSGMTADDALTMAVSGVSNPVLRARFSAASARLRDGRTLSRALREVDVLDADAFATLSTAESAGRLDDAIRRYAEHSRAQLEGASEQVATWLPRIVYLAVVGALATQFF